MIQALRGKRAGFTLLELLIVLGMLGLVVGAIYSTYVANQRSASSQGEVVEVQQNLRVALDYLSRDLKTAGMLVPPGTTALAEASGTPAFPTYSTSIMSNTASGDGHIARIERDDPTDPYIVAGSPSEITLTIEAPATATSPNPVDPFRPGDKLRLIRPADGSQPLTGSPALEVCNIANNPNRGVFGTTRPSITVKRSDSVTFSTGDLIHSSDLLTRVADAGTFPMTVSYFLVGSGVTVHGFTCPAGQKCLVRQVNRPSGPAEILASNISSLRFSYLDDSYHESSVPGSLGSVRAVRISLEGATARTAALSGARLRGVTTVVKLRNRR